MNPVRLVMVTPRYWPLVGETERFVSNLAAELRSQAVETTVLTARWAHDWPAEVFHRETRIVRLSSSPCGAWGTWRYMRAVASWLWDHHREVDLAYAMNLRHDAYAALGALRGVPTAVVLRAQAGDCRWFETARGGRRTKRRTLEADAIVPPLRSLARELQAAGYDCRQVHQIANGVEVVTSRSSADRYQARIALAEVNQDLTAAEYAPVAVSVGGLHDSPRLFTLVDAWRTIAARWPTAKLWIVGDGPSRELLYQRIGAWGLHHQVLIPGTFDDLADVFSAADVFVTFAATCDGGQFLLEAMAAGLPAVAADSEYHRELLEHNVHGFLVPGEDAAQLAEAIGTLFESPALAAQHGEAARQHAIQAFSPARMGDEHLALFRRVLAGSRRGVT